MPAKNYIKQRPRFRFRERGFFVPCRKSVVFRVRGDKDSSNFHL